MNTGSLNRTVSNHNDMDVLYRRELLDYVLNYMNNNSNRIDFNSLFCYNPQINHNTLSLDQQQQQLLQQQYNTTTCSNVFPMNNNSLQEIQQLQFCTNNRLIDYQNISNPVLIYLATITQYILQYYITQQHQQNECLNSLNHSNYSLITTSTNQTVTSSSSSLSSSSSSSSSSMFQLELKRNNEKLKEIPINRIKRYKCTFPECTKAYYKRSHLNEHYHLHTGVKPYLCNQSGCNAKFSRADQLSRHRRAHTGERNFFCNVCLKRFKRSDHLKVHLTRNVCTKMNI
ncbi:Krueppel-like factor 11 [Schistosoma japonicum]|uniref:Krueppel-like factor 11 n=1 Tax=Schistosoma japonicum TaxID=6182 RepID=A0A4Z2DDS4_SCHJA|nr:Krueppel-like factor 11 [Schistosoma japonicum]